MCSVLTKERKPLQASGPPVLSAAENHGMRQAISKVLSVSDDSFWKKKTEICIHEMESNRICKTVTVFIETQRKERLSVPSMCFSSSVMSDSL